MIGGYSTGFTPGAEENTELEVFHNYLNSSMGNGIIAVPGTVAWVENYAKARLLHCISQIIKRYSLQFSPDTMTAFIPRWENILGIIPNPNDTENDRRNNIKSQWSLVGSTPTEYSTRDYIISMIGDLFVKIIKQTPAQASTFYPGGLNIEGGLNIPDGPWSSTLSYLPVRVYQPIKYTDAQFYEKVNSFSLFLNKFLPSYVNHKWGRFCPVNSTVSIPANQIYATSTGFNFFDSNLKLSPGEELEFFDDAGNFVNVVVNTITSSSTFTIVNPVSTSITNKQMRRLGFFLDTINLDNAFISFGNYTPPVIPTTPPTVPDTTPPTVSISSF